MLEQFLTGLGFSEKESAVYCALLSLESASAPEVARAVKLKRPTAYVVLDSLTKKGLVSALIVGKHTRYSAESPERLVAFIERQRLAFEEQAKTLHEVLPRLKAVRREGGERPIVKYFEGKEGVVAADEELYQDVEEGGEVLVLYPRDLVEEIFSEVERKRHRDMRLKRNIAIRALYTAGKGELPPSSTGQRLRIDEGRYPLACDIAIYKDKVRFEVLGKKLFGVFIKSSDVAETLRSLFRLAYDAVSEKKKPGSHS